MQLTFYGVFPWSIFQSEIIELAPFAQILSRSVSAAKLIDFAAIYVSMSIESHLWRKRIDMKHCDIFSILLGA